MPRPMKDSGIEWIGEIPQDWDVTRLKYLFQSGDGGLKIGPFGSAIRGKAQETGAYKIYNQAHLISNNFSMDRHFIDEQTYQELKAYEVLAGDMLFSMMGTIGKCRIMPEGFPKGIMDSHLLKARLNAKIHPCFFQYVYDKDNSPVVIDQLLYYSKGSIMNGLNSQIVKNIIIPLPPLSEQQRIANYLDTQCTEIDRVLEKTRASIEDYKKLKQAVITQAVTKGVRGARPMKDSGIEWIGEIPQDWDIVPLKYLCTMQSGKNLVSEQIAPEGLYPVYGGNGLRGFYEDYNSNGEYLLVGRQGALCGNVHKVNGKFWATEHAVLTKCSQYSNFDALYYLLVGMNLNQYVSNTAAQPGLAVSTILNTKTCLVPLIEQAEIAEYLDAKCTAIDTLIDKKQQFLTELESYKKSLIYECVTGKREIPPQSPNGDSSPKGAF